MSGFVKLHRKFLEWEWYHDQNMVLFFIHCLLRANHKPRKWQGIDINPGQFVSGRKQLSIETGLSERQIRTCISKLKETNELTTESSNRNTIYTLKKWNNYQSREAVVQQSDQQETSKRPTTDQQATTNKNEKNEKNEKKLKAHAFDSSPFYELNDFKIKMWDKFRVPFCLSVPIHSELDNYSNTGKKYIDWCKTGFNWIKKRKESKDQRDFQWMETNFSNPINCIKKDHGEAGYFQYKYYEWNKVTGSKDRNKFFDSISKSIDDWRLSEWLEQNRDLIEL